MMDTRRIFFKRMLAATLYVLGWETIAGCNVTPGNEERGGDSKTKTDPSERFGGHCDDFSKLIEEDYQMRKKMGYDPASPLQETQCQYCNLWLPPRPAENCGGCTLFTGPIEPKGTCTYWAPRQS